MTQLTLLSPCPSVHLYIVEENVRVNLWMGVVGWMKPNQKVICLISTNQSTRNATSTPIHHLNQYYILILPST